MHVILKPTKAELIHNTDGGSKLTTYIQIKYAGKIYQSQISKVDGDKPVWDESFDLVLTGDGALNLAVWDYDSGSPDDLVGDCLLNLNQLAKTGNNNSWIDLYFDGASAGRIWVDVFIVPMNQGPVLLLAPLRAELTHDTDGMFSKMDPFVRLNVNGTFFTTAVHTDGGKKPIWNDSFAIPLVGNGSARISVWDWDGANSDLVGEAEINTHSLLSHGQSQVLELKFHDKKAGLLYIQVTQLSK